MDLEQFSNTPKSKHFNKLKFKHIVHSVLPKSSILKFYHMSTESRLDVDAPKTSRMRRVGQKFRSWTRRRNYTSFCHPSWKSDVNGSMSSEEASSFDSRDVFGQEWKRDIQVDVSNNNPSTAYSFENDITTSSISESPSTTISHISDIEQQNTTASSDVIVDVPNIVIHPVCDLEDAITTSSISEELITATINDITCSDIEHQNTTASSDITDNVTNIMIHTARNSVDAITTCSTPAVSPAASSDIKLDVADINLSTADSPEDAITTFSASMENLTINGDTNDTEEHITNAFLDTIADDTDIDSSVAHNFENDVTTSSISEEYTTTAASDTSDTEQLNSKTEQIAALITLPGAARLIKVLHPTLVAQAHGALFELPIIIPGAAQALKLLHPTLAGQPALSMKLPGQVGLGIQIILRLGLKL